MCGSHSVGFRTLVFWSTSLKCKTMFRRPCPKPSRSRSWVGLGRLRAQAPELELAQALVRVPVPELALVLVRVPVPELARASVRVLGPELARVSVRVSVPVPVPEQV